MRTSLVHSEFDRRSAETVAADAVLAPSVHNTQPWRLCLVGGALELDADHTRQLSVVDPGGQALHVSCGAALYALRLSVRARLGRAAEVRYIDDDTRPDLLAEIRLGASQAPSIEDELMLDALPRRHSYRGPLAGHVLAPEARAAFLHAGTAEGASVIFPDPLRTDEVLDLVREAEFLWARNSAYRQELARWTQESPVEGVPSASWGTRDPRLPRRDFSLGVAGSRDLSASATGTLAVVLTTADQVQDRLVAGQAVMRMHLLATRQGLALGYLQQAVERPYLRQILAGQHAGRQVVQAVVCVGAPSPGWQQPPTPRRPVADVLST